MKITADNLHTVDFTNLVLTFKTTGPVSQMAKLHKVGCSMIRASKHTCSADLKLQVEDLMEREFPVTICKCAK